MAESGLRRRQFYECECECGSRVSLRADKVKSGHTRSCGCLHRDYLKQQKWSSDGRDQARRSWDAMMDRCFNPKHPNYSNYGERGITVCEQWRSFEGFFADMGERPAGKTLGRIDNDVGYQPGNCRWETVAEQSNNRRNTKFVTIMGKRQPLTLACRELGIERYVVYARLRMGWSEQDAFNVPVKKYTKESRHAVIGGKGEADKT